MRPYESKNNSGMTLVEVMVALVILSVGLLGLAGLQITGLRGSTSSNYRVQAVMIANDMADRMHANLTAVDSPDNAFMNVNLQTAACPGVGVNCNAVGADCTAAQMAAFDMDNICQDMASYLPPNSTLTVTCNDNDLVDGDPCTDGSTHDVSVNWNEVQDSALNAGQPLVQTVTLTVTP